MRVKQRPESEGDPPVLIADQPHANELVFDQFVPSVAAWKSLQLVGGDGRMPWGMRCARMAAYYGNTAKYHQDIDDTVSEVRPSDEVVR